VSRADDAEPIEGTPDLDLSEEVFPETPAAEAAESAETAVTPETPGGEASETAPLATDDLPPELVDEGIEADAAAPDEPGPGDSEGELPAAPDTRD
jgi:hypothetical protein